MYLTQEWWIIIFIGITAGLYGVTRRLYGARTTTSSFLVSNRSLTFPLSAITVAVAWAWAPALLVSSQRAFQQGIPGLLWFSIPNALALVLFAFLAHRMKQVYPQGITLPEFMGRRFGGKMETLFGLSITVVQGYAVIVNLTGAYLLLSLVTGMGRDTLVLILGAMMATLSLTRGIRSSFVADVFKAGMVIMVLVIIVPLVVSHEGVGFSGIWDGHGGAKGEFTNPFNWDVAWTFGIPLAISLWAGITIDQQQWQRAFSMKEGVAIPSWIVGGLLFLAIPLALGVLGFIAANSALGVEVKPNQTQLAGFNAVNHFLPTAGVIAFTLMIVAGLVAAGASALNAFSSIGAVSFWRRVDSSASENTLLRVSRASMVLLILVGMYVAHLPNVQIIYLILLIGAFRGSLMIPTILSLFWSRLSGTFTFVGILLGMAIGTPLFLYGNHVRNANITSFGILVPVGITLVMCIVGTWLTSPRSFNFRTLPQASPRIAES